MNGCVREKPKKFCDFFPINKQNKWKLLMQKGHECFIKKIYVDTVVTFKNRRYYKFVSTSTTDLVDSMLYKKESARYFRVDRIGNVYEYIDTSNLFLGHFSQNRAKEVLDHIKNEQLFYKFDADVGDKWFAYKEIGPIINNKPVGDVVTITLESKKDTVITPIGVFKDCYCFGYDFYSARDADVAYHEWFAEGIGLVKQQGISPDVAFLLSEYSIK